MCGPEISRDPGVHIDISKSAPPRGTSSLSCFRLLLLTSHRPDLSFWVTPSCQDAVDMSAWSLLPLWWGTDQQEGGAAGGARGSDCHGPEKGPGWQ